MKHVPQTIRLAIGLNTHNTFTLPDPISALRQSTCQLHPDHGTELPTTHIDMTNPTRLCIDCATHGFRYFDGRLERRRALLQHRMNSIKQMRWQAPGRAEKEDTKIRIEIGGPVEVCVLDRTGRDTMG
jgi:hypothetical protein